MAVAKKKIAKSAKSAAPKAKAKKAPAKKASKKEKAPVVEMANLDRKGLSGRARLLKTELLAIRFNIQSPNLNEYRKKRRELASVLAQLG